MDKLQAFSEASIKAKVVQLQTVRLNIVTNFVGTEKRLRLLVREDDEQHSHLPLSRFQVD